MRLKNQIIPYFLDESKRDIVIVFPGGGYSYTSPREAKIVCEVFHKQGYHSAVFEYRNELLCYPNLLHEGLALLENIVYDSRIQRVFLLGFSAGGHYALLLSIHTKMKHCGLLLAYPVVSSKEAIRHDHSFRMLLGEHFEQYIKEVSLEDANFEQHPPVFLWHTMDDSVVKVENALTLVDSLRAYQVPVELHIFASGVHGLSLATKEVAFDHQDPIEFEQQNHHVSKWLDLAVSWLKRQ